jgi:hypothetical protein
MKRDGVACRADATPVSANPREREKVGEREREGKRKREGRWREGEGQTRKNWEK